MKYVMIDEIFPQYEQMVAEDVDCLYYARKDYLEVLQKMVGGRIVIFCAIDNHDVLMAALPAIIKQGKWGPVMNSLPFFGSNPGIIFSPSVDEYKREGVVEELLSLYWSATNNNFLSVVLIESPFNKFSSVYRMFMHRPEVNHTDFIDPRIGMRTVLPIKGDIMDIYHTKTRNLVRKAIKEGVKVGIVDQLNQFQEIFEIHKKNMSAIGAPVKPDLFIDFMKAKLIDRQDDMVVYKAVHPQNESIIAGLVVFIHNQTAEYFMPVIKEEYRSIAPVNLVIYAAMNDLRERGVKYWNWGGTKLPEQQGVYHFKERFGAEQGNYSYYIKATFNKLIEEQVTPRDLSVEYPYCYVVPYLYLNDFYRGEE